MNIFRNEVIVYDDVKVITNPENKVLITQNGNSKIIQKGKLSISLHVLIIWLIGLYVIFRKFTKNDRSGKHK